VNERATFGVWCPTLTPLDEQLRPDVGKLAVHASWLLEQGCHGIVLFGTTGEANSFTVAERQAVLEGIIAAGMPPSRLIVGTGCCAVGDTAVLTRHAISNGCSRVLVLPPFYYKGVSEQGTIDAYAREIEAVGDDRLRFFFYRIPQLSGVDVTAEVVDALVERYGSAIAGLKDSSGDRESIEALCRRFGARLDVLVGTERLLKPALASGATGCITATANVHAPIVRALYDERTDAAQQRATLARDAYESSPMIPTLKAATASRTKDEGWLRVRPPLVAAAASIGG
jgi:4-hydroxy-tetrahydrodipicolinate synthase